MQRGSHTYDWICRYFFIQSKVTAYFFIGWASALLLLWSHSVKSEDYLQLTVSHSGEERLVGKSYVFEDSSGKSTIEEVVGYGKDKWSVTSKSAYGITDSTIWVRFDIIDTSNKNWLLVNKFGTIDEFDIWRINHSTGVIEKYDALGLFSDKKRPISSRYIAQPVSHENAQRYTYYIAASGRAPILLPLYLFENTRFLEVVQWENLFLFGWLGIIVGLFFYNLFLYFFLRVKALLWYCFYVATFGWLGLIVTGLQYQYFGILWTSNSLGLELDKPGGLVILSVALSMIGMVNFCRHFIDTKNIMPNMDKVLYLSNFLVIVLAIPNLIIRDNPVSFLLFLLQTILLWVLMAIAVYAVFKRVKAATYYIIGWSVITIGMTSYTMSMRGVIPNPSYFQIYAAQFASAIEMILLSLAVGFKVVLIQREKIDNEIHSKKKLEKNIQQLTSIQEDADRDNIAKANKMVSVSRELKNKTDALRVPLKLFSDSDIGGLAGSSIKNSVASILDITRYAEDLTLYFELESNKFKLEFSDVNLRELCESLLALHSDKAQEKSIDLSLDFAIDEANEIIIADEVRLRQILTNLLSNAIHYTKKGHVKLFATSNNDLVMNYREVIFKILDTGIGIDLKGKSAESLFNGEYTSSDEYANAQSGTGLGLYISQKLANLHNGSISYNDEGFGSSFEFRFRSFSPDVFSEEQLAEGKVIASKVLFFGRPMDKSSCLQPLNVHIIEPLKIISGFKDMVDAVRENRYQYVLIDNIVDIEEIRDIIGLFEEESEIRPNKVIVSRQDSYITPVDLNIYSWVDFRGIISTPRDLITALTTNNPANHKKNNVINIKSEK